LPLETVKAKVIWPRDRNHHGASSSAV
jgi:hypothetical protein